MNACDWEETKALAVAKVKEFLDHSGKWEAFGETREEVDFFLHRDPRMGFHVRGKGIDDRFTFSVDGVKVASFPEDDEWCNAKRNAMVEALERTRIEAKCKQVLDALKGSPPRVVLWSVEMDTTNHVAEQRRWWEFWK